VNSFFGAISMSTVASMTPADRRQFVKDIVSDMTSHRQRPTARKGTRDALIRRPTLDTSTQSSRAVVDARQLVRDQAENAWQQSVSEDTAPTHDAKPAATGRDAVNAQVSEAWRA